MSMAIVILVGGLVSFIVTVVVLLRQPTLGQVLQPLDEKGRPRKGLPLMESDAVVFRGGGWVSNMHATWPFMQLMVGRDHAVLQGRGIAPIGPVVVCRNEDDRVEFTSGDRMYFRTKDGRLDKVRFNPSRDSVSSSPI